MIKGIITTVAFTLTTLAAFSQQENKQSDSTRVFAFVEQFPEFPGGDQALNKFLAKNIVYPKKERRLGIEGRVLIKFIVYEDGSVHDVTVTRSSGNEAIDAEAIRVVKLLPTFKPGKQQGKAVKVFYNLPITFRLA